MSNRRRRCIATEAGSLPDSRCNPNGPPPPAQRDGWAPRNTVPNDINRCMAVVLRSGRDRVSRQVERTRQNHHQQGELVYRSRLAAIEITPLTQRLHPLHAPPPFPILIEVGREETHRPIHPPHSPAAAVVRSRPAQSLGRLAPIGAGLGLRGRASRSPEFEVRFSPSGLGAA